LGDWARTETPREVSLRCLSTTAVEQEDIVCRAKGMRVREREMGTKVNLDDRRTEIDRRTRMDGVARVCLEGRSDRDEEELHQVKGELDRSESGRVEEESVKMASER